MDRAVKDFRLNLAKDKLSISIDCDVPTGDIGWLTREIREDLSALGVPEPPTVEEITDLLRNASNEDPIVKGLVLVEGTPAGEPTDGRIEWSADYFSTGFLVDEKTGTMDFRRRTAQSTVTKDLLLAKIHPSIEGKPGKNVLGQRVMPRPASKVKLRIGSNVRVDREKGELYATKDGRIRLDGSLIFVDELYSVDGSIGLATGHISHPGALEVKEDILEGAEVKTNGAIEVHGMIQAARIHTKGNLTVRGGITRCNSPGIQVGGNLQAKFILGSRIQVKGDVVVEREIVNSLIETTGKVIIPSGRIVGGQVRALKGFELGQLGSEAAVPTRILVGNAGKIRAKREESETLQAKIQTCREKLNKLVMPQEKEEGAPSADPNPVMELLEHALTLEKSLLNMEGELEVLRKTKAGHSLNICFAMGRDIESYRSKIQELLNVNIQRTCDAPDSGMETVLLQELARLEKRLEHVEEEIDAIRAEEVGVGGRPSITVHKKLHVDAVVHMDDQIKKFLESRNGPCRIVFDDGKIEIL